MIDKAFEKASRLKLRFQSSKGLLSLEELWDLPLQSKTKDCLDSVARSIYLKLKDEEQVSFVNPQSGKASDLQLSLDLVKHVISVRLEEQRQAAVAVELKEKKEKLLTILNEKQDAQLRAKSAEEILQEIQNLQEKMNSQGT